MFLSLSYSSSSPLSTSRRLHNCLHDRYLFCSFMAYCNSLNHSLPVTQFISLSEIQYSLARLLPALLSTHTSLLHSNHWLMVEERIHIQIISITNIVLHKSESTYLPNFINIRLTDKIRSLDSVSLSPLTSKLAGDRSFHNSSNRLLNTLPTNLR